MEKVTQQDTSDNGFLIGDIVVKEFTDDLSLYEVRGLCNQAVLIDTPCCAAMYVHRSGLRVATVVELNAKKRLPQLVLESMGDDEDISNHISLHCVVDGKSGLHHD